MPKAEVGSTKYIANKMKSKGLQRLRWYCQACEKQCRDENGFKCHVASESHVRNMQLIGEDPRKAINDFSRQFERDFLQLLRTGHGEKKINLNHFYQEYIGNKEHIHMTSTKWTSLTEFAKSLGRQGIVRVEEDEKKAERGGASGLTISWVDNSPEALRRQQALQKKERQDRGDEELEQRLIREQIRKARRDGLVDNADDDHLNEEDEEPAGEGIKRVNGEKVVLSFGTKKASDVAKPPTPPLTDKEDSEKAASTEPELPAPVVAPPDTSEVALAGNNQKEDTRSEATTKPSFKTMSLSSSKPKNVFAVASKKNALGGSKKLVTPTMQKPMSEAERIMKEEIDKKRQREIHNGNAFKRQRVS